GSFNIIAFFRLQQSKPDSSLWWDWTPACSLRKPVSICSLTLSFEISRNMYAKRNPESLILMGAEVGRISFWMVHQVFPANFLRQFRNLPFKLFQALPCV